MEVVKSALRVCQREAAKNPDEDIDRPVGVWVGQPASTAMPAMPGGTVGVCVCLCVCFLFGLWSGRLLERGCRNGRGVGADLTGKERERESPDHPAHSPCITRQVDLSPYWDLNWALQDPHALHWLFEWHPQHQGNDHDHGSTLTTTNGVSASSPPPDSKVPLAEVAEGDEELQIAKQVRRERDDLQEEKWMSCVVIVCVGVCGSACARVEPRLSEVPQRREQHVDRQACVQVAGEGGGALQTPQ